MRNDPDAETVAVWAEDCAAYEIVMLETSFKEYRQADDEFPSVGKVIAICKRLKREAEAERMRDFPQRLIDEEKQRMKQLEQK